MILLKGHVAISFWFCYATAPHVTLSIESAVSGKCAACLRSCSKGAFRFSFAIRNHSYGENSPTGGAKCILPLSGSIVQRVTSPLFSNAWRASLLAGFLACLILEPLMKVLTFLPRFDLQRRVAKALSSAQFAVQTAVSAKECLQFAQFAQYEGVLVDSDSLIFADAVALVRLLRQENSCASLLSSPVTWIWSNVCVCSKPELMTACMNRSLLRSWRCAWACRSACARPHPICWRSIPSMCCAP